MAIDKQRLKENQQQILQTINNGLKSKVKENSKNLENLDKKFNQLLYAIGGGMFAIILLLIQILIRLGGG